MTTPRSSALVSVIMVICWSSGFVGAELGSRASAEPLTLLAWRFLALAPPLLVAGLWFGSGALRLPAAWGRQAGVALFSQVAYLGLVFESVRHGVPGGTAALLAALQPLLVAAVAFRLLGERTSRRQWIGLAVGMGGVLLVVSGDLRVAAAPAWAYLLPVGAMLSLATGTVLERRLAPPESLVDAVTMQACVTAVAFLALAVGAGSAAPPAEPAFWAAVVWLVVLASLGGYGSYLLVVRWRGATAASALLYLTPPTTTLWVWLMFGQPVAPVGLLGLLVTGIGVGLHVLERSRRDRTAAHGPGDLVPDIRFSAG